MLVWSVGITNCTTFGVLIVILWLSSKKIRSDIVPEQWLKTVINVYVWLPIHAVIDVCDQRDVQIIIKILFLHLSGVTIHSRHIGRYCCYNYAYD